jgi:hypothetical protein
MSLTRQGFVAAVAYALPAVLLILIGANQLYLAHTAALSPWSGGSFGMFSTTDSPANRHLHAFVGNDSLLREVLIPPAWQDQVLRATTLPNRARLAALAEAVAELESGGPFDWDQVTIQVWAGEHDPDSLIPTGTLLRRERLEIAKQ